ncbi:VaFE repeat-containing surface-anchored protein, partial [Corynebacterium guaraldiae]|uniref:VaFE repeat-containing surface-anchored protein n=1 Tax=Corynebacterium guaraldiae TaxID=3051103 RepID=UPI001E3BA6E0
MVLTAVFTAIAVIAAMVTVPWTKAGAAEPTDFVPNNTLGAESSKGSGDMTWGPLVWAGKPPEGKKEANKTNDVGWAWCIDYITEDPMNVGGSYHQSTAGAVRFDDPKYQDAAIGLAIKLRDAAAAGEKSLAANYSVYLAALLATPAGRMEAVKVIKGQKGNGDANGDTSRFDAFTGSPDDFTALTGLRIVSENGQELDDMFEADPSVKIDKQPADAFITIVGPNGLTEFVKRGQRVFPPDQPGLPGEESGTPKISTNADFANGASEVVAGAQVNDTVTFEGLVPGKEYTLNAELISKEDGKTVLGKG